MTKHRAIAVAAAVTAITACSVDVDIAGPDRPTMAPTATSIVDDGTIIVDLREPRQGSDFGSRSEDVVAMMSTARYRVLLPDRTIEGEFNGIRILAPVTNLSEASGPLDRVRLRIIATTPDEVNAAFDWIRQNLPIENELLEQLNNLEANFNAKVTAADGQIVPSDFRQQPGGSMIQTLGLWASQTSIAGLIWRVFHDGVILFNIGIQFDNGTDPNWFNNTINDDLPLIDDPSTTEPPTTTEP